jgi:methanogenic corrinoid protein MtbC1
MSSASTPEGTYLACLERRDLPGALEVARSILEADGGMTEVVAVLAAAQREVGRRWARNEWSVAQEHAATSITDRVAAAAALWADEPVIHPTVAVVCAEGEWHTLPARMCSDLLRSRGWDIRFLGGSIPARDLQRHLADDPPSALLVSCAISMHLPGAQETIAAAHRAGVPVLAGGRGFGADGRRALALGADAYAKDVAGADAVLHRWGTDAPAALNSGEGADLAGYRALRAERLAIVDEAEEELHRRVSALRHADDRQVARTREDLGYLAAFLEAATLTRDPTILSDYLPWLAEVLTSRGVDIAVLRPTVDAVVAALEFHDHDEAATLLRSSATPFLVDGNAR